MAISGGDGSIILDTKVDTSGLKKGVEESNKFAQMATNEQRKLAQSLANVYRQQGLSQSEAQKKAWQDLKENKVATDDLKKATDDVVKKTKEYGDESQKSGDKAQKSFSKVKSAIGTIGKSIALVGTAAAAGFVAISKSAVDSYAEYEQLKGGVETLFKDSADVLMGYADKAYQTAGLSANDYMATVTSFSASLLQSLGGDTAAAADYADQAIVDMSDNANKMGTSMEMIQNAYQGFAKQNYTMLDNLKLGYGGTKEEMQRLLDDAGKISGIKYDISSFADVTQAIHIIQTELGITGTTALEASSTIQGSASAMKASWQNLLTGMADPTQNFEQLLQNFISSVGTFLGNLLPVFTTATQGVLQMVQGLLPQVPVLIEQMLPIVIDGVSEIIAGLVEVLPQIVNAVMEILPQLVTAILNLLPQILEAGIQILLSLIQGLTKALPQLIAMLPEIINTIITVLLENLPLIIKAGIELLIAIVEGLSEAIPQLIDYIPTIIETLITTLLDNLPLIIECAIQLLVAIITGLVQALPQLVEMVPQIIWTIVTTLLDNLPQLLEAGKTLLTSVVDGIKSILSNIGEAGKNIVEGLWEGIKNAKDWLLDKIKSFASTITDGIKSFFGIHSPSTVFRDEIGENLMLGLANGITGNEDVVSSAMSRVANGLANTNITMPNIASGTVLPYFANAITPNNTNELSDSNGVDSRGERVIKEEHYHLNESELMTIVYRLVKGGERINGISLISGGAY